jgi:hypothetical protein
LVANEFSEMFGLRHISLEIVFIVFVVLMKGFDWENYAANTTFLTKDIMILELNYVLKFFLSNAILIILGCINYGKILNLYTTYKF